MVSEFFPKDAPHTEQNMIGCLIGGRQIETPNWPAFSWHVHPEHGVRLVMEAGGAQDAWGRDYTVDEFEAMLRDCEVQARHESARDG